MFQSYLLFENHSYYSSSGKRDKYLLISLKTNSLMLAEGEGATATSLGRPVRGVIFMPTELIHRVPSVEGATATSLGTIILTKQLNKSKNYTRKNAPNKLFLVFLDKKKRR